MNEPEFVLKTQSKLCSRLLAGDCFDRTRKAKVRLKTAKKRLYSSELKFFFGQNIFHEITSLT